MKNNWKKYEQMSMSWAEMNDATLKLCNIQAIPDEIKEQLWIGNWWFHKACEILQDKYEACLKVNEDNATVPPTFEEWTGMFENEV